MIEAVAARQKGLRKLAFLDVQWPDFCSFFAESCWREPATHQQKVVEQFEKLRDRQQQRQWLQDVITDDQQQVEDEGEKEGTVSDSRLFWELKMGLVCSEGLCTDNASDRGLWGAYGPEEW